MSSNAKQHNLEVPVEPDMGFSEGLKKGTNKRFWHEDDEITILKGIIDFNQIQKNYPFDDLGDFYGYIKNMLHINVFSRKQL